MVMGINAGLEQRLFGLAPSENWWPGGHPNGQKCHPHAYRFMGREHTGGGQCEIQ